MLSLDKFEGIRLAYHICLPNEGAAEEMEIPHSTFTRLIEQDRNKVADFLVRSKLLTIERGNIHFRNNITRCMDCGHMLKTNRGIPFEEYPEYKSKNLLNLAGEFGHSKCCISNNHKKIK